MPRVELPDPPAGGPRRSHREFREWLLASFFDHLCSYCLLQDDNVEVDHYEPTQYAPDRVNDPHNLLLACGLCNGRGGKSDYHPAHSSRQRLPRDTSGHLVIDVRRDDFATMFAIESDGAIAARGPQIDRARWNIALLKLDLAGRPRARREVLDLHSACDEALQLRAANLGDEARLRVQAILDRLLPQLARRVLLMDVFGLAISPRVSEALQALPRR